jgi:ABC-type transport system substrate-binding protein
MIRKLIFGLPALFLVLIFASFLNVALLTTSKRNEFSIGMLGEPSTLNPIKAADSAAGQVNSSIFNGLLQYNENLEVAPDLAESFSLSQTTTFFFKNENAALSALLKLEGAKAKWAGWELEAVRQEGSSLLLRLKEPGMEVSREIAMLLVEALPAQVVRVETKAPPGAALEKLRAAVGGGMVLRIWVEGALAFEATVLGTPEEAMEKVKSFFGADVTPEIRVVETQPFLAEPEVVFQLRRNVKWHDGTPFTSRDPAFTYRAIMDEAVASPRKPDYDTILRVETPHPHEFRVIYRRPYSPALTSWMMSVLPAHILEGKPQEWWVKNFDRHPIGTGPFKFQEWQTNEYVRLTRNPDYFKAPGPWLDGIVYRILPDQLALRLAFETHQVDFWGVDPWAISGFEKDSRFDLFSMPGSSYSYIGWNLKKPPFDDEQVRIALAHAINIPEMVKYILYGHGEQSTGIFLPQMWFFNPDVKPFIYDPQKAKDMLAAAGWVPGPDGILTKEGKRFAFTLITNNGNEIRRDIATLVQDNLRQIGIEVKIETYEWAVFLRNYINKGNFDAMVLGWALGPDYDQYQIWHSSQNNPEQLNVVGYNNSEVDRLLEGIRQEYQRSKIISMAGKMQEIIYRQQPYMFLYVPKSVSVVWKDSFRIRRPKDGGWIDTPIEMTKAGWSYYSDWFYRPEYADQLPPETKPN